MKSRVPIVLLMAFICVTVNAVWGQERPSFQTAIDTIIPAHPDLGPLKARAEKDYNIVDYQPDRLVIEISSTGDYVYIHSDGRMVVASERKLIGLADKDKLTDAAGQIIDMIDDVSAKIDADNKWHAMYYYPLYYAQKADIYKATMVFGEYMGFPIKYDGYLLRIPDMDVLEMRFARYGPWVNIAGHQFQEYTGSNDKFYVRLLDVTELIKPGDHEFEMGVRWDYQGTQKCISFEAITVPNTEHITIVKPFNDLAQRIFQCKHIEQLFPPDSTEYPPSPAMMMPSADIDPSVSPASAVYNRLPISVDVDMLAQKLSGHNTLQNYLLTHKENSHLSFRFYPGTGDLCYVDNEGRIAVVSSSPITSLADAHILITELGHVIGKIQAIETTLTNEAVSRAFYENVFYNTDAAGISYKRYTFFPTTVARYFWTLHVPDFSLAEAKITGYYGVSVDGDAGSGVKRRGYSNETLFTSNIKTPLPYGDHTWEFYLGLPVILETITESSPESFSFSGEGRDSVSIQLTEALPIEDLFGEIPTLAGRTKGDVNNDGKIRSDDAILALRISAGMIVPTDEQQWAADMNDDGKIRSNDAIIILRKAAGLAAPSIGSRNQVIAVSLDRIHDIRNGKMMLSLKVDKPNVLAGGDISVTYDSSSLGTLGIIKSPGIIMASNIGSPGLVHISFAGMDGLSDGTIATIAFDVLTDSPIRPNIQEVELYGIAARPMDVSVKDAHFPNLIPDRTDLLQNFPNSFNPDTWIPYQLAEDVNVNITIYDPAGKIVRTLDIGHRPAGTYTTKSKAAYWDGKNEAGESVSSGVYFYTIQAGEFTATKKMILAK